MPVAAGQAVHMTSSFGIAQLASGDAADDLLRAADEALYQAKPAGKDRTAKSANAATI